MDKPERKIKFIHFEKSMSLKEKFKLLKHLERDKSQNEGVRIFCKEKSKQIRSAIEITVESSQYPKFVVYFVTG